MLDFGDSEPVDDQFDAVGYSSTNPLENMPTDFVTFEVLVLTTIVLGFSYIFFEVKNHKPNHYRRLFKVYRFIRDKVYWSMIFTYLFEAYLELTLNTFIGIYSFEREEWIGFRKRFAKNFTKILSYQVPENQIEL